MLERADVRAWVGSKTAVDLRRIDVEQQSDAEEPRLVHGDFNPTNIVVDKGAVTGILDGNSLTRGDLLRHLDPLHHGEIEAGLVAGGLNVPPDWRRKSRIY